MSASTSQEVDLDDLDAIMEDLGPDDDDAGDRDMDEPGNNEEAMQELIDRCETRTEEDREKSRREEEKIRKIKESMAKEKLEEEAKAAAAATPAKVLTLQDKKRIRFVPPGLKVFDGEKFLHGFRAGDLSVEEDFGYDKRSRLLDLGIDKAEVDATFSDPFRFVLNLAAESCSAMVANEKDPLLRGLYSKALFDLLKNYSYRWKLDLNHLYTALANLGINTATIASESNFSALLSSRLEAIKNSCRKTGVSERRFSLPKMRTFYLNRVRANRKKGKGEHHKGEREEETKEQGRAERETDSLVELSRLQAIRDFVGLVSDLIASYPDRTDFRPTSDDWTSQLILIYVVALVASDQKLITDPTVTRHVTLILHSQFDSFSTFQWTGDEKKATEFLEGENSANDEQYNACGDVTEVFAQVGCFNLEEMRTWDGSELPRGKEVEQFKINDHHHNMMSRLQLLPPSLRGNQVRKAVAFLNVQYILDPDTHSLVIENAILELDKVLEVDANVVKLKALYDHHYVMFNLVPMIDAVIGNEPDDFSKDKLPKIKKVQNLLQDFTRKMRLKFDNHNTFWVIERVGQVTSKWEILKGRWQTEQGEGDL